MAAQFAILNGCFQWDWVFTGEGTGKSWLRSGDLLSGERLRNAAERSRRIALAGCQRDRDASRPGYSGRRETILESSRFATAKYLCGLHQRRRRCRWAIRGNRFRYRTQHGVAEVCGQRTAGEVRCVGAVTFHAAVTDTVGTIVRQVSEDPAKYLAKLLFSFRGVDEVEAPETRIVAK